MIDLKTNTLPQGTTTLVTVTYADRIDYLRELLLRAFNVEKISRAIVVSNASISDLSLLETQWGVRLHVIRLQQNTGSANGYAVGIAAALTEGATSIWLMDDDNAPIAGALTKLHHQLAQGIKNRGAKNSAVLGFRPTHQADIARGLGVDRAYPPRSSFFGFHYRQIFFKIWRRIDRKPERPDIVPLASIPYAPYGGLLASRELFEHIGLPMRELILYADDTEYTRRITSRGGSIQLVVDAELEDLEGSWILKDKYPNTLLGWLLGESELRAFYSARNQAWFDKNVWMHSKLEYHFNKFLYLSLLKFYALKAGRSQRHLLLRKAIKEGKDSRLGTSSDFPL